MTPDDETTLINSPAARRAILYAGAVAVAVAVLWYFRGVLLPVGLGIILAYLLAPMVRFFEEKGLSTVLAISAVYLILGVTLAVTCIYGFPRVIGQMENLARSLPDYGVMVTEHLERAREGMYRVKLPQTLQAAILSSVQRAELAVESAVEGFIDALFSTLGHTFSLLAAPVLAFYFLLDRQSLLSWGLNCVSERNQDDVLELLSDLDLVLMGFIRSRIVVSVFVAASVALLFTVLGLPYFLIVAVVAGLADLVPYFGPILGAIPALAVALARSPASAVKVLVALVVIQQVESAVVSPLVMGERVKLHPAWVIIALFAGAQVAGLLGMLVAVPVFASGRVIAVFIMRRWRKAPPFVV